jgi:hypothetical protein
MARDKKNDNDTQNAESTDFSINDKIRMVTGQQIYEGYVIKTDAKSKTPIVVCLIDHLADTEQEFCRMVRSQDIEKINE